jgi:hypothetical protein
MSEYPNSGLLFKNFKKKQPNHPDYIGTCTVNGVALELSAWIKPLKAPRTGKFMSISFSPPRPKKNTSGLPPAEGTPGDSPSPTGSAEHEPEKQDEWDGFIV